MSRDDEHHIIRETNEADEDLDRQEDDLDTTLKDASKHTSEKDKEWDGPKKDEFHTDGGGEEAPPGSPEHDRGIISGS